MSNNEIARYGDADTEADLDNFEEQLRQQTEHLMSKVQAGDFAEALKLVSELNETRDRGLYREVGRLTRSLHEALVNFHIDAGNNPRQQAELSQISDASDRLAYVVNLTSNAANRTMDLVEASMPIAADLKTEAHELRNEWHKLGRRQLTPEEFRQLYKRMDRFLNDLTQKSDQVHDNLSEILLAQGYQDLTGQLIQKVTTLVREVEENLVRLVKMAGRVDQITGIQHDIVFPKVDVGQGKGPQLQKDERPDVVSSQDDVDDLLSSLGF